MSELPTSSTDAVAVLARAFPPVVERRKSDRRVIRVTYPLQGAYAMRTRHGQVIAGPWGAVVGIADPGFLGAIDVPAVLVATDAVRLADPHNCDYPSGTPLTKGEPSSIAPEDAYTLGARVRVPVLDLRGVRNTPKGAAALTASLLTAEYVASDLALWADEGRQSDRRPRAVELAAVERYVEQANELLPGSFAPWLADRLAEVEADEQAPVRAFPTVPAVVRGIAQPGIT